MRNIIFNFRLVISINLYVKPYSVSVSQIPDILRINSLHIIESEFVLAERYVRKIQKK